MMLREYISLSFCYMTFVIGAKIERNDSKEKTYFDVEPYNYIFNRSTSFLDGDFVKKNYKQLKRVLKHYKQIDIDLLDLLTYP